MIIARVLAIVAGLLILAAVAHATIYFTTGYGTPHAYLTITVAIGVAVASVVCGMSSTRALAIFLGFCIACGEGYNFLQSSNRLISATEASQAPKREYAKLYAKAEADVTAAKAIVNAPQTSRRLIDALHAKELADKAVTDKSAEKGCVTNCRQLLQTAATEAADEVTKARAAIEADHRTAETNLATAKGVLAGMKAPESPTPLADRLGVEPWKVDVLIAALGSIAINGLACGLMIFGAHHPRRKRQAVAVPAVPANVIDVTPVPAQTRPKLAIVPRQPIGTALDFLHDGLAIVEGPRTEMAEAYIAYLSWCKARAHRPMEVGEFVDEMEALCKQVGIRIALERGRDFLVNVQPAGASTPRRLGAMGRWKRGQP